MLPSTRTRTSSIEADACRYNPDTDENSRSNEAIMQSLRIVHLEQAENDLNLYEKVGLLFLLCGDTRTGARFALERLTVCCYDDNSTASSSSTLAQWARSAGPDWSSKFCEALSIVRCNSVLRRFGFHLDALQMLFLPHQPDVNMFIHPMLKWMYYICEQLDPQQTGQLIDVVGRSSASVGQRLNDLYRMSDIPVARERFLELWMLLWLAEGLIAVGEYNPGTPSRERTQHAELAAVRQALMSVKTDGHMRRLGESLDTARIRFNFTSDNVMRVDAKKPTTTNGGGKLDGDNRNKTLTHQFAAGMRIQSSSTPIQLPNDTRYMVRFTHAGYVLIINHVDFKRSAQTDAIHKPLTSRTGSDIDADSLETAFAAYGYKCERHIDLTATEVLRQIDQTVRRSAGYDSLIVCIMSHGYKDHVYGSDTVPIRIDSIIEQMAGAVGIPKLLVVQACQDESSSPDEDDSSETQKTLKVADMCVAYSTLRGFVSYRHTKKGSWFIQQLCKAIVEHGNREHIVEILTKVANMVDSIRGPLQQLPYFGLALRKHFYLPQTIS